MQILIKGGAIYAAAEKITYGVYDEPIKKWRLADGKDNLMYYMIDNGFELVTDVTLPEDYEDGKYLYQNGEFVFNEGWKPYVSTEERIANLEAENAMLKENMEMQAEVLDFLLMQ